MKKTVLFIFLFNSVYCTAQYYEDSLTHKNKHVSIGVAISPIITLSPYNIDATFSTAKTKISSGEYLYFKFPQTKHIDLVTGISYENLKYKSSYYQSDNPARMDFTYSFICLMSKVNVNFNKGRWSAALCQGINFCILTHNSQVKYNSTYHTHHYFDVLKNFSPMLSVSISSGISYRFSKKICSFVEPELLMAITPLIYDAGSGVGKYYYYFKYFSTKLGIYYQL